jgi:hypothetical protein
MIRTGFHFDSVQMPLNPFDGNFRSFQHQVVPEAVQRGIAVLGMKPFSGTADPLQKGVITAEEALRYAMSVPGVTVTITGMDKPEVLRQNLQIAPNFKPMTAAEMQALSDRVRVPSGDGRYELYKVSINYDNPDPPEDGCVHRILMSVGRQRFEITVSLGSCEITRGPAEMIPDRRAGKFLLTVGASGSHHGTR